MGKELTLYITRKAKILRQTARKKWRAEYITEDIRLEKEYGIKTQRGREREREKAKAASTLQSIFSLKGLWFAISVILTSIGISIMAKNISPRIYDPNFSTRVTWGIILISQFAPAMIWYLWPRRNNNDTSCNRTPTQQTGRIHRRGV